MNTLSKWLLLVLLAEPFSGFGQQPPASRFDSLLLAAKQAQAASDYATALNDLKQAVRIRADMPELWANLGLVQQQTGDVAGAMQSFQSANRMNPALYVPNLFLGIDYVRIGKAKEAIPFLEKAVKANKSDPQAPLALGRAYLAAGRFSAATQELSRATGLDPKLGTPWFALGIAGLDQVEADGFRMTSEGKDSPFAVALFAESLEKQARFAEAAARYKMLLDAQPQPPCIRSGLGFALLREHDPSGAASAFADERASHPECSMALLGQARVAIDNDEKQQAGRMLAELWSRDHGFVASNAVVLLDGLPNEKASQVAAYFTTLEALPTGLRSSLAAAFNGEVAIEDEEQARADAHRSAEQLFAVGAFRKCAERIQADHTAPNANKLRLLAACSYLTGDSQRAANAAAASEQLEPHSLEALYWSIEANEKLALKSLARFQQLEPDSTKSHVLLGDMYEQLERHEDAQAEYRKALALAPEDPAALLGLASACINNKNVDQALETARQAMVRSPQDPELNLIVAEGLMSRDRYAEAEPYLKKSLRAKPQMLPHIHALLGKVYAETGNNKQAIEELKLGASSDEDGAVHYLLARLYRAQGDLKDASEALEQVKTIKVQRRNRGVKSIEDPDLSSLEPSSTAPSTP